MKTIIRFNQFSFKWYKLYKTDDIWWKIIFRDETGEVHAVGYVPNDGIIYLSWLIYVFLCDSETLYE